MVTCERHVWRYAPPQERCPACLLANGRSPGAPALAMAIRLIDPTERFPRLAQILQEIDAQMGTERALQTAKGWQPR